MTIFSYLISLILSKVFLGALIVILMGFLLRTTLVFCDHLWVKTKSQTLIFMILPLSIYMITKVISGNIALSLGMVGALSIVRFRNPVKNSFELVSFFVLISIGITATVNLIYTVTLTSLVIAIIASIELAEKFYSKKNKKIFSLSFREGESLTVLELVLKNENNKFKNNVYLIQATHNYEEKKYIYKFASQNKIDIQNLQTELLNQVEKNDLISLEYVYN